MKIQHTATDQNWADETTVYWFEVTGTPDSTKPYQDGEYGLADCNGEYRLVDDNSYPIDECNVHHCVYDALAAYVDSINKATT